MDDLRYVQAEGHHIAYRIRPGADDRDVVVFTPGGTIPMEFLARDRIGARLLDGLSRLGRVILFDRRGIGMSDPITDWTRPVVEQWAEDLAAVVAICEGAALVVALGEFWGPARLCAAAHPDAIGALALYEPTGSTNPIAVAPGAWRSTEDWIARICPSRADDQAFREWFDLAGRTGASPAVAARLYERPPDEYLARLADAQARIAAPVLVLRRPGNLLGSTPRPDPVADAVPNGRRVDLDGTDFHWLGEDVDAILAAVSQFVTGEHRLPEPERVLCAVLFTDLVGSTERAADLGDARWKALLDRHDGAIADEVGARGGVVIKSTGDGVLATFPSVHQSLRAAAAIHERLRVDGLSVRIGLHVGDIERRGNDVAGIAVHVAARVMSRADAGETLVTEPVAVAVRGTGHEFESAGDHELKGVPGRWMLARLRC
jgi:class 3 adenylate cyclase